MATKISFKQLGEDIANYIGGQVFIKSSDITSYKTDLQLDEAKVLLKNGNVLSTIQKENLKIANILDDDKNLVGIAYIKQYDSTAKKFTLRAIEYGSGKGKFYVLKSKKKLEEQTEKVTSILFTDLDVPSGVTIKDLDLNHLIFDENGTVGKIRTIDLTTNTITTTTITDATYMSVAPDTKRLVIDNGGQNYQNGDIIESSDIAGVFAKVTKVDTNGAILEIEKSTSTMQSVHGTNANIINEQEIYGGYGKNWAALSKAAVLVAQVMAEKFEYEQGYEFKITNTGIGYTTNDILATDVAGVNVIATADSTGKVINVEYTREDTLSSTGTGAVIKATASNNIFIIPNDKWNEGITIFTLTNDDGASVEFFRDDDNLIKYSIGKGPKVYKFVYNKLNGIITQSAESISGGTSIKDYVTYAIGDEINKDDLIIEDAKLFRAKSTYTNTGVWNDDKVKFEEISEGSSSLLEYSDITNGETISKGTTVVNDKIIYRATSNVTKSDWNTDKTKFEELKTSGAILNEFVPNHYYAENEMIVSRDLIYTRKTAGTSGTSLGDDLINWELKTKLHSSGGRYVKFNASDIGYAWFTPDLNYAEGDSSLLSNNKLVAPVDGLYYVNMCLYEYVPNSTATTSSILIRKNYDFADSSQTANFFKNEIAHTQETAFSAPSLTTLVHLNKDDYLSIQYFISGPFPVVSSVPSEFGLIAEDQSDNFMGEAVVAHRSSWPVANTNLEFESYTNPNIFSTNGTITLPEDGAYLFILEPERANSTLHDSNVYLKKYLSDSEYYVICKNYCNGISAYPYTGFTYAISGYKGDKFIFQNLVSTVVTTQNATMKGKIKLYKIKSVEHKLDPSDLYAEYVNSIPSGQTPETYEEWVKRMVQRNQYHLEARTVQTSCPASATTKIKMNYYSGMSSMLDTTNSRFVAPIAGLYCLKAFPCNQSSGSLMSSVISLIMKNKDTLTAWNGTDIANGIGLYNTNIFPGGEATVWLDKGEYLTLCNYTTTAKTYPVGTTVEFSLIQGGTGLENYPNMWPENTEINLGNGLYGYRATGKVTIAANREYDIKLPVTNVSMIYGVDGGWAIGGLILPSISYTNGTTTEGQLVIYKHSDNSLHLWTRGSLARTNAIYDVWAKYTK